MTTTNELLQLLADSREYTHYFAELGVETIELSSDKPTETSRSLAETLLTQNPAQRGTPSRSEPHRQSSQATPVSQPPRLSALFAELAAPPLDSLQSGEC